MAPEGLEDGIFVVGSDIDCTLGRKGGSLGVCEEGFQVIMVRGWRLGRNGRSWLFG